MKICLQCQKAFKAKRKEQVYCSKSCASVKKGMMRRGQKTGKRKNWIYSRRNIDKDGYVRIYAAHHPYANGRKMIPEHVMVMELHIKRQIKTIETVHHINGNRIDNRIENLHLMTRSEHSKKHIRKTIKLRKRTKDGKFA